jgi:glutamate-1-semialdehyde 2,1-aminomutase
MVMITKESAACYERARKAMPAGVNSNGRARKPYPIYYRSGKGAELWDVDGNRYLDLNMGNGAVVLGHGDMRVQEAIREALQTGLTLGVECESAVELAELFLRIVPSMDLVRFTNTGTEAVLHALHIARFATGKMKIAKVEGCYHGWSDEIFVSAFPDVKNAGPVDAIVPIPGMDGLNPGGVENVVVMPFNDVEQTRAVIEANAKDLAAVILEPVMVDIGFVSPTDEYLSTVRDLCTKHDIVLIFDEVLTSFRLAPGGAQEFYGVVPDLAVYGKAMSNGYPIAAVAGKDSIMRLTEPGNGPAFVGTYNGHAIPVAAALATLPLLADGSVQRTLTARTDRLARAFGDAARRIGITAQFHGSVGHIHWYFTDTPVKDYRSAATTDLQLYSAFASALQERGVLASSRPLSHHHLSLAHDDAVIEELEVLFETALKDASTAVSK